MVKKRTWVALWVSLIVALALGVFLAVWMFGASYPAFDGGARSEGALGGLDEGFVPQGLTTLPENDAGYSYAVSGYGTGTSRIYLIGGTTSYFTLTRDGKALDAHFGGIAATDSYLYVTEGKRIDRVALADVFAAEEGAAVAVKDCFETGMQNAFCSVSGDTLLAGEFYRTGNYETEASHHITCGGEENPALVYLYHIDETAGGGVEGTPYAAFSVRGLVQGIALRGDTVVLSCSWGLSDSTLVSYSNPLGSAADTAVEVGGKQVPVYFLGSSRETGRIAAPCMSEGIVFEGDRLVVLFESGCNKYKYFVRRQVRELLSVPVTVFGK